MVVCGQYQTKEKAWEEAKKLAIDETETYSVEHECPVSITFDKEKLQIVLDYNDGERCFYDVVEL